MKYQPFLLILALFLGITVHGAAQEVKSDYEIQQNFKTQYDEISSKLTDADGADSIQKLIEEVKVLEENFQSHRELLNVALYPETFNERMVALKRRALSNKGQITTIEEQNEKLKELTREITSYDVRLDDLNSRTDSLSRVMQKSRKSEEQLTAMVRRYRESLQQRDELILSFVDSVMITYQKLNIESMQDLENAKKKARFNADGNALKMILSIANENISLLNSDQNITTAEFLRMSSVQNEFKTMWNKVGDKLIDIYAEGDKEKARKNINKAITEWDKKVSSQTWASLNKTFDEAGLQLPKFDDSETFYRTLDSYLSESIKASEGDGSKNNQKNYEKFSTFWTQKVQAEWMPYMINAEVLNNEQVATIDQQLEQWASNAEPGSNMLVYLLGFSLLAIVALGVMYAREKKGSKE